MKISIAGLVGWFALAASLGYAAAPDRLSPGGASQTSGTISGRVFNPATAEYVRNAEIRIPDTNIVVYTGMNAFTDAVGRIWIRLVSYLTYLN